MRGQVRMGRTRTTKHGLVWTLTTLAFPVRADLAASAIEAAFLPLAERLPCQLCKQSLVDRVKQVIVQWSMVKVSSPFTILRAYS